MAKRVGRAHRRGVVIRDPRLVFLPAPLGELLAARVGGDAVALAGVLILLGSVIVCLEARDNFSDANEKRRMATAMPL